ncbi:MAG: BatD family protein [Candidatus Caenarcaniphilales bacterium]|nr:BatD family protein [Candidatus Caenarcaniphilales bacterium]
MKISSRLILILCLFLSSLLSVAQAELFISLSKKEVGINESLDLIIDYDNATTDNLKFPLHTDTYDVIGEASSSSVNIINGNIKKSKRKVYTLKFKKTGIINLPISNIKSNNVTQNNANYQVRVVAGSSRNSPRNANNGYTNNSNNRSNYNPRKKAQNLFARLSVSNKNPYVNEQILLKLKIYHRGTLKNISLPDLDLNDFIHKRVEETQEYREFYEGNEYFVYEIPFILFPIKAGTNRVPAAKLDLITIGKSAQIDPFDPFNSFSRAFSNENSVAVETNSLEFEAQNLPQPAPAGFTGYVGELTVNHSILNSKIDKNDVAVISTSIYGNGNPNNINNNFIQDSDKYSLYKDKYDIHKEINKGLEYFNVESTTAIIPENSLQKFQISTKEIINFNPINKSYERHEIRDFLVDVNHNKVKNNSENNSLSEPIKTLKRKVKKAELSDLVAIDENRVLNYQKLKIDNLYLLLLLVLINLLTVSKKIYQFFHANFANNKNETSIKKITQIENAIKKSLSLSEISQQVKTLEQLIMETNEENDKIHEEAIELKDRIQLFIENTDRMNYGIQSNNNDLADEALKEKALKIVKEVKSIYG